MKYGEAKQRVLAYLHEALQKGGIEAEWRRIGISYTAQDTSDTP